MKIITPEVNYELICYNLDCKTPLNLSESLCPSFYDLKITIDEIGRSSHLYIEDKDRIQRLVKQHPVKLLSIVWPESEYDDDYEARVELEELPEDIPENIKAQLFSPQSSLDYNEQSKFLLYYGVMDEELRNSLLSLSQDTHYQEAVIKLFRQSQPEEIMKADKEEKGNELKSIGDFFLTTLRLLKSWRIWMGHFYNFMYSDFFSDYAVVNEGHKIKPYTLENKELKLIKELRGKTEYFQQAAVGYLRGIRGKIPTFYWKNVENGRIMSVRIGPDCFFAQDRKIADIEHNIDPALCYYMRAHNEPFYREDISLIQLFIALEALFIQEGDEQSIKYRLKNRVAMLLGESPARRKDIEETLEKLYEHRSEIVHGSDRPNPEVTHDLLQKLFEYVRLSILYFIALAECEKKEVVKTLDNTLKFDNRNILGEEVEKFYTPELHKVLQFDAEG